MKLLFKTSNPNNFRSEIIELIESDKMETWNIHKSESIKYLKHTSQWGKKGVINLTTNISKGQLIAEVLKFEGEKENVKDFEGYYLGRFCEIIFVNFQNMFTLIEKE